MTEIHHTYRARKEHTCAGCRRPIVSGTLYDHISLPPWMDYEGDVDDEGRPVAYLLPPEERRWHVEKYHPVCWARREGYYYEDMEVRDEGVQERQEI